jgi:hypothetical protein
MPTGLDRPHFIPTHPHVAALERLGDEASAQRYSMRMFRPST